MIAVCQKTAAHNQISLGPLCESVLDSRAAALLWPAIPPLAPSRSSACVYLGQRGSARDDTFGEAGEKT